MRKILDGTQYGAYFRKMAIDGYILVVDRSDTKAYIRELQAVSRNINQIAKRANATGTVYRQDIEDIKKAVDEIWRLQVRAGIAVVGVPAQIGKAVLLGVRFPKSFSGSIWNCSRLATRPHGTISDKGR